MRFNIGVTILASTTEVVSKLSEGENDPHALDKQGENSLILVK